MSSFIKFRAPFSTYIDPQSKLIQTFKRQLVYNCIILYLTAVRLLSGRRYYQNPIIQLIIPANKIFINLNKKQRGKTQQNPATVFKHA